MGEPTHTASKRTTLYILLGHLTDKSFDCIAPKFSMYMLKHSRECYMKHKARGEAECLSSIEAKRRVLYFSYSTSKAML